jgi:hypothetical protein
MDFYKYLDRDFSSQHFFVYFFASKWASKWAKSVGNSNFCFKNAKKSSKSLDKNQEISKSHDRSQKSRLVSKISISLESLDNLDKNLDAAKS